MAVTPSACKVAAVVTMMARPTSTATPMPITVSSRMRSSAARACSGARSSGSRRGMHALVLHLLRRLPEQQEGRERRAEDGDHRRDPALVRRQARHEAARHAAPLDAGERGGGEIGEQRERGPFQDGDIARVAQEHLHPDAERGEEHDVEEARPADEEAQRVAHGAEIGAQRDGVGEQDQEHAAPQQRARIVPADGAGEAAAGGAPDPAAHLLHHGHQRPAEQRQPAQGVAEGGAGLRVGADRHRVVVGRAGDQPRSEHAEEAGPGRPDRGAARFLLGVGRDVRRAGPHAFRRQPRPTRTARGAVLRGAGAATSASAFAACRPSSANQAMVARRPAVERRARRPAEHRLGARDVRAAPARIVFRQGPVHHGGTGPGEGDDAPHEVGDRQFVRVAEVDRAGLPPRMGHEPQQPVDHVRDEAEGARLAALAVDRDVVPREGLGDDVRDHAAVIGAHPRAVGVEDARHAHLRAAGAGEIEDQRLGGALALVIAGARPGRVDVAPIVLRLRVAFRVAIDLAGRGLEEARAARPPPAAAGCACRARW